MLSDSIIEVFFVCSDCEKSPCALAFMVRTVFALPSAPVFVATSTVEPEFSATSFYVSEERLRSAEEPPVSKQPSAEPFKFRSQGFAVGLDQ